VAMAEGKHPVPSRTRKLSPPAPMVLPGRLGGRVGRCRNIVENGPPSGGPFSFRYRGGTMAKTLKPHGGGRTRPAQGRTLPRDVADEIARVTKPTQVKEALSRLARATELLDRGDTGAAVAEAHKAKELSPRSPAVREVLGMALYGQARWHDALTEMKAYRRMSGRPDQNHIIADCLRGLGRPAEAIPLADEELRAAVPNAAKAEAVIVAASALADQERYPEALSFLGRARTRDDVAEDYTLRLWYVKGDILERAGRRQEAAAEFGKIVRHDAGAFDAAERLEALA
jgi:tetratricopeptide (TPR) repeat protein